MSKPKSAVNFRNELQVARQSAAKAYNENANHIGYLDRKMGIGTTNYANPGGIESVRRAILARLIPIHRLRFDVAKNQGAMLKQSLSMYVFQSGHASMLKLRLNMAPDCPARRILKVDDLKCGANSSQPVRCRGTR